MYNACLKQTLFSDFLLVILYQFLGEPKEKNGTENMKYVRDREIKMER